MTKNTRLPEEFIAWPSHTGNWGRWENDYGTLNTLSNETVLRGIRCVKHGEVVPCSRPLTENDPIIPDPVFEHRMICAGKVPHWPEREVQNASDSIFAWIHGTANTHIDALAHIGFKGFGFNGHRHSDMVSMEGTKRGDVTAASGILTRGILIDVARKRGVDSLRPGEFVQRSEIEEDLEDIHSGDAVFIRLGTSVSSGEVEENSADVHGTWAGVHPECIEMLAEKDIALFGTDGPGDAYPSPIKDKCDSPVHVLCLAIWGIHLIHNMNLERLAHACEHFQQKDFLLSVAALNLPNATGSLVNPLAVL